MRHSAVTRHLKPYQNLYAAPVEMRRSAVTYAPTATSYHLKTACNLPRYPQSVCSPQEK